MSQAKWKPLNSSSNSFWQLCNMLSEDVGPAGDVLMQTYSNEIQERVATGTNIQWIVFAIGVVMVFCLIFGFENAVSNELRDLRDCEILLRMLPSDLLFSEYVFEKVFGLNEEEFKSSDIIDVNRLDDHDFDDL
eukprot:GDKK01072067.1.p1 GENE.GDKK01072067.1~~GDKK01072067.1.p1  ORF type:complete len:151 (-),score=22.79 GDKK01072067.1:44-445(-)